MFLLVNYIAIVWVSWIEWSKYHWTRWYIFQICVLRWNQKLFCELIRMDLFSTVRILNEFSSFFIVMFKLLFNRLFFAWWKNLYYTLKSNYTYITTFIFISSRDALKFIKLSVVLLDLFPKFLIVMIKPTRKYFLNLP